jgi:hypothetical protein
MAVQKSLALTVAEEVATRRGSHCLARQRAAQVVFLLAEERKNVEGAAPHYRFGGNPGDGLHRNIPKDETKVTIERDESGTLGAE